MNLQHVCKKKKKKKKKFLRKRMTAVDLFEGLWLVETSFPASAKALRPQQKELVMFPSSAVHGQAL